MKSVVRTNIAKSKLRISGRGVNPEGRHSRKDAEMNFPTPRMRTAFGSRLAAEPVGHARDRAERSDAISRLVESNLEAKKSTALAETYFAALKAQSPKPGISQGGR